MALFLQIDCQQTTNTELSCSVLSYQSLSHFSSLLHFHTTGRLYDASCPNRFNPPPPPWIEPPVPIELEAGWAPRAG
jgi:hypothetical protein